MKPGYRLALHEYSVPKLRETLEAGLFLAELSSSENGAPFNQLLFLYRNGRILPLGATFGGHGLMSAVVVDGELYCTYSWGSGLRRSHVARITPSGDRLLVRESRGFPSVDLFVRLAGGRLLVEEGAYRSFNASSGAVYSAEIPEIFDMGGRSAVLTDR
jgi:hypothetical protein